MKVKLRIVYFYHVILLVTGILGEPIKSKSHDMFLPRELGEHLYLYGYLELCDKLCLEAWEHICRSLGVALLLVPPNLFASICHEGNIGKSMKILHLRMFSQRYHLVPLPPYGWIVKVNGGNPQHLGIPLPAESWNTSYRSICGRFRLRCICCGCT